MDESIRLTIKTEEFTKALRKAGLLKKVPKECLVQMFEFADHDHITVTLGKVD